MALNFDPTKKIKGITSTVKIFEEPTTPKNPEPIKNDTEPVGVSSALDSRETGVKSPVEKPLVSHHVGVSSALDKKPKENKPVSQALATPLDVRELGVRKNENSALDVSLLVGKEKTLVFLACEECKKIGSLETNYIPTDELRARISIDSNGLRNLIHRVKEKGFFEVEAKQLGRNGLRKFKISKTIYQQFLNSALDSRETGVSQAVVQPLDTALENPPRKKEGYLNNNSYFLPEALTRIGLKEAMIKTDRADLQEILNHLAYAVENKEIKVSNPLGVVISTINNPEKIWVSGNLTAEENKILAEQERRIAELKAVKDQQLRNAFEIFKLENPHYVEDVKRKNSFITTADMAEKIAFSTWREEQEQNQSNGYLTPKTP